MDFDLRLLPHARTLAEEGSYARAARALHLTQPALTMADAGLAHLTLDQGLFPRQERAQRSPPGTILITQGQVEQQIQHRRQPQPRQAFGEPGAYAPQAGDRLGFKRLGFSLHQGGDGLA